MSQEYAPHPGKKEQIHVNGGADRLSPLEGERTRDLREREAINIVRETVPYVTELEPKSKPSSN